MDAKIEKSHGATAPGPRGSAPAGVGRFDFSILTSIVTKSQDISKKVRAISQIHAISQKNVAISIISAVSKSLKLPFQALNYRYLILLSIIFLGLPFSFAILNHPFKLLIQYVMLCSKINLHCFLFL